MIGVGGRTLAAPRPILGDGRQKASRSTPSLRTVTAPFIHAVAGLGPASEAGQAARWGVPLWSPNCTLDPKSDFLLQKCILEPKIDFGVKK